MPRSWFNGNPRWRVVVEYHIGSSQFRDIVHIGGVGRETIERDPRSATHLDRWFFVDDNTRWEDTKVTEDTVRVVGIDRI